MSNNREEFLNKLSETGNSAFQAEDILLMMELKKMEEAKKLKLQLEEKPEER